MQVALRPGTELVCNCPGRHSALVSDAGSAPSLPDGCTGSFWALPARADSAPVFGALVSSGVIAPHTSHCAYLT